MWKEETFFGKLFTIPVTRVMLRHKFASKVCALSNNWKENAMKRIGNHEVLGWMAGNWIIGISTARIFLHPMFRFNIDDKLWLRSMPWVVFWLHWHQMRRLFVANNRSHYPFTVTSKKEEYKKNKKHELCHGVIISDLHPKDASYRSQRHR